MVNISFPADVASHSRMVASFEQEASAWGERRTTSFTQSVWPWKVASGVGPPLAPAAHLCRGARFVSGFR